LSPAPNRSRTRQPDRGDHRRLLRRRRTAHRVRERLRRRRQLPMSGHRHRRRDRGAIRNDQERASRAGKHMPTRRAPPRARATRHRPPRRPGDVTPSRRRPPLARPLSRRHLNSYVVPQLEERVRVAATACDPAQFRFGPTGLGRPQSARAVVSECPRSISLSQRSGSACDATDRAGACAAPFRVENGAVVALRRRQSIVLRGRQIAGRWRHVPALHCCRHRYLVKHADSILFPCAMPQAIT
jgi:hypothetical protein